MGFWEHQVVPRFIDKACGNKEMRRYRERVVAGLEGTVVEIGFGSGLNMPLYPTTVERILAVEPSEVGRSLAARRVAASSIPVEFVGLDGEDLPLEDASVDHAVSAFTLCTIPDAERALRELERVLRPGGTLHFVEHGLAREPNVVAWQHRLNGIEQRLAGGCNLDRPIDTMVSANGFAFDELHEEDMRGPAFMKPWGHLYWGVARAAA